VSHSRKITTPRSKCERREWWIPGTLPRNELCTPHQENIPFRPMILGCKVERSPRSVAGVKKERKLTCASYLRGKLIISESRVRNNLTNSKLITKILVFYRTRRSKVKSNLDSLHTSHSLVVYVFHKSLPAFAIMTPLNPVRNLISFLRIILILSPILNLVFPTLSNAFIY